MELCFFSLSLHKRVSLFCYANSLFRLFEELIAVERTYKDLLKTTLEDKKTRVERLASFLAVDKGDSSMSATDNSPPIGTGVIGTEAIATVGFTSCPNNDGFNEGNSSANARSSSGTET